MHEAVQNIAPQLDMPEFERIAEAIRRNKFIPIPPADRNFVSHKSDDFIGQGIGQLRTLVRHGLKPFHNVLEIGSGIGRLALPLSQYSDPTASYFGLDNNLSGVAWCHENITTRYPNFEFAVINAVNLHYKHRAEYGQENASQAHWPIPPRMRFGFACAFSLFTHLVTDEVQHYLEQVAKHLKPGGRFASTWFLIDDDTKAQIRAGRSHRPFHLDGPGPMHAFESSPGYFKAIGYEVDAVHAMAERAGFKIVLDQRGGWRTTADDQDTLVMQKAEREGP